MESKNIKIERRGIYVEPISACNLKCRMCYSNVINDKGKLEIPKEDMISFVQRFGSGKRLGFGVLWCGTGELFLHRDFPQVVNNLSRMFRKRIVNRGIRHFIITNGTIDRLDEFHDMGNITFYVSIDGPKEHHEWNRGKGTYEKAVNFCKKAYELGCGDVIVRTLVTKDNVSMLACFEDELKRTVDRRISINLTFPYSNRNLKDAVSFSKTISMREFDDSKVIPREEMKKLVMEKYGKRFKNEKELLPTDMKDITTYVSLNTSGVFSCCEGIVRIGSINTEMKELFGNLQKAGIECLTCPLKDFC